MTQFSLSRKPPANFTNPQAAFELWRANNGPTFEFNIQGSRSKGIKNMQIFCFDMMLMRLCAKRGIGPGFLVHDSHLFDGVDGRQVAKALEVGARTAEKLGFQYIVTMNSDDAFKETIENFDLKPYILPTRLTDATEDTVDYLQHSLRLNLFRARPSGWKTSSPRPSSRSRLSGRWTCRPFCNQSRDRRPPGGWVWTLSPP